MGGRGMLVGRGCEVAGDKAGLGGHGAGMRRVLMVFVILAAVMGGEARAVVVMGRVRSDCCDRQAEFSGGTIAAEYTVTAAAGSAWKVPLAATVQHVRGPDLGGGTKGLLDSLRNGLPSH